MKSSTQINVVNIIKHLKSLQWKKLKLLPTLCLNPLGAKIQPRGHTRQP